MALTSLLDAPSATSLDVAHPQLGGAFDHAAFEEAARLVMVHGDNAVIEAAAMADELHARGNIIRFSHWRQVEQLVQLIQLEDVIGEIH